MGVLVENTLCSLLPHASRQKKSNADRHSNDPRTPEAFCVFLDLSSVCLISVQVLSTVLSLENNLSISSSVADSSDLTGLPLSSKQLNVLLMSSSGEDIEEMYYP